MTNYKLINQKTNAEIKIGDTVTSFRNEEYVLVDFTPPKHEASTGRVTVADDDGKTAEFYPGVIYARIEKIECKSLQLADLSQATAVTINQLRTAFKKQNYTVRSLKQSEFELRGFFERLDNAFAEALALKASEGGYIEIIKGEDELIWDSKNGRSNA